MKNLLKNISIVLDYIYGYGIMLCLFIGGLTFLGYIIAFFIGGEVATAICVFIYKKLFKYLIYASSVIVCLGLINMYIKKQKALNLDNKKEK